MNLKHPNWTGKAYRTRDEAFGPARVYMCKEEIQNNNPAYWVIGIVLLIVLAVLAFAPIDAKAQTTQYGTIDYIQRSVDTKREKETHNELHRNRISRGADTTRWFNASPKYRSNPRIKSSTSKKGSAYKSRGYGPKADRRFRE